MRHEFDIKGREIDDMLAQSPLGKQSVTPSTYDPTILFTIPRANNRQLIGIKTDRDANNPLPFTGRDIWNAYEFSWLNQKGKPQIAHVQFYFPCETPRLLESKSFKLYLQSYNNTSFDSLATVNQLLLSDLAHALGTREADMTIKIDVNAHTAVNVNHPTRFSGICLDELDIRCDIFTPHPAYLTTGEEWVSETLFSDLLRSNCPITGQPDWASIQIIYTGKKIDHENLLKYIISARNHTEFHEHCVERIFMEINTRCLPEKLCVYARYTRRGGLDINPYRANDASEFDNFRLWRQ